ncbi:TM0106 family RecB-like putative nuclease [Sanguibacter suarezii]|uniref:TM0106 family RecB-like putative nuclease n=1 Tax=Sanguibacter suarezii TaxID=60921 RepID=UPI000834C870|nr:TM0106 family RecB-like putative nuclease [Sanguibacter suarezii]
MFLLDDVLISSASDLTLASTCEFALLRTLDRRLGRVTDGPVTDSADAMLERTAELGLAHEARVLAGYVEQFGRHVPPTPGAPASAGPTGGVVHLGSTWDAAEDLRAAHDRTLAYLRSGVDVVAQGTLFDGRFLGRPDFLVRTPAAETTAETVPATTAEIAVVDAKLARRAKVTALLQLAAYADQLLAAGVPVAPRLRLVLGDTSFTEHALSDILPVYRERRARLELLLDTHRAGSEPVAWDDARYLACGTCADCRSEVAAHRDPLLVAGLTVAQRTRLRDAGLTTIDALAASTGPVPGMPARTLTTLREQAALQVAQDARPLRADGRPDVQAVVFATGALAALPAPDAGDLFFDFEGDPLWAEPGSSDWGLEYLFGLHDADSPDGTPGAFRTFWAHDRVQERQALLDFFALVGERRRTNPGMHVYHYAPYEVTALRRLVGRHGVGEEVLDDLLREGVLVDLYSTVRQSVRVSQPSYSIKKLEPLYMGDDLRNEALDNAADSITEYARACALREAGDDSDSRAVLDLIADYNRYDCLSTLRLRDWLLARAAEHDVTPAAATADDGAEVEPVELDPMVEAFTELAGPAAAAPRADRSDDDQALLMLGAALGYHRRGDKPFWWEHFDRLTAPVDEWAATRDVLVAEEVRLERDWYKEDNQRSLRRELTLVGRLADGSTLAAGSGVWCIYDAPLPAGLEAPAGAVRQVSGSSTVLSVGVDEAGRDVVRVEEVLKKDVDPYAELPMAVGPGRPVPTGLVEGAVRELAQVALRTLESASGNFPAQSALDLLRRMPPQMREDADSPTLPTVDDGRGAYISAITTAVRALDRSYLAVQGPPGTGKTYIGARVIERLVRSGWHVGVVAPSHAVVEHMLDTIVEAGVPGYRVGKKPVDDTPHAWTAIPDKKQGRFLGEHREHGCVIGGTAWDFTNVSKIGRRSLDLIVIDEAGQFSLANTLAVSLAAQNLLLLGDPQQLPQVTQGTHPEPVDTSALGWVARGQDTLPADRGYFLERSWRMHPALCAPVSRLAYAGRLTTEGLTAQRHLDGLAAGVHVVDVPHLGRSVASPEEAAEVVRQVQSLLGRAWTPGGEAPVRPLGTADILVVAGYNAQRSLITAALRAAGADGVRVGTVDKFQGQEAAVVIVSMAASAAGDVPRGMSFLLSRNRVNVAVSRGQWAAIVVRSPALTDFLPSTPAALAELGAFIGLCAPQDGPAQAPGAATTDAV